MTLASGFYVDLLFLFDLICLVCGLLGIRFWSQF